MNYLWTIVVLLTEIILMSKLSVKILKTQEKFRREEKTFKK